MRSRSGRPTDERTTILFMQSQTYFGADSQVHALTAQHLDRDRFRVIVACNDGAGAGSAALDHFSRLSGVEVLPIDFGPSRSDAGGRLELLLVTIRRLPFVWALVRLARFARANRVDVVHGTEKPRDVIYGYLIGKVSGARTVTQLHVEAEDWIKPLARRVMKRNDALVGVSRFVARSAVEMGCRPDRVHHVLNALDVDRWNPEDIDVAAVRHELGVDDDVPLVAIVARIFPWKGHERLVRALALVRDRGLPFHLLVVGEDDPRATPDGGSYSATLRHIVNELDLAGHVTFTGFRADVPALMAAIDVFSMPSAAEPFGMVFLEALAMGTPVVAIRSGGVAEVVEDGVTGLLSDPDDDIGLADNLASLLSDPARRARMGAAGRDMVLSRFAPRRMADEMAVVYRKVLDGEPAS